MHFGGLGDESSLWRPPGARLAMIGVWAPEIVTRRRGGVGRVCLPHKTLSKKAGSGGIVPLRTVGHHVTVFLLPGSWPLPGPWGCLLSGTSSPHDVDRPAASFSTESWLGVPPPLPPFAELLRACFVPA